MSENKDKDIPRTKEYINGPVLEGNFNNKPNVHIYWGPGQLTISWPNYNGPNKEKWRHFEPIQIPQVIRFVYDALDEYDTDKWLPPMVPPSETVWWLIYSSGYEPAPFGGTLFWVRLRKYRNGIAQSENSSYTINPIDNGVDITSFFEVGIRFKPVTGVFTMIVDYAAGGFNKYYIRGDITKTVELYE